ncbi:MAG TPA: xylulokinase [Phycisphaerales bacterium]|nr:xylulokinase [Phycisphaerales bacterium]
MSKSEQDYVLGIDVGTSAIKVLAVDRDGSVMATASRSHPVRSPRTGWSEQSPDQWYDATIEAIRRLLEGSELDPSKVRAIGFAGQMHGLVTLDRERHAIRPAILWNDQRSASICLEETERLGLETLLHHTGNRMLPGFTAPKLLWMREHEPEAYDRIAHVLLPKDHLRLRMGSALATDVSDASGTSVFDCGARTWSDAMFDALELPANWWPKAWESTEVVDRLNDATADATGLPAGTPLVAGAGDQAASAVGTGAVENGVISTTIGTSGVVFASSDTWRHPEDGSLHAFCHAVPNTWHLMGVMLNAAACFEWFCREMMPDVVALAEAEGDSPYARVALDAERVEAGANGLFFLPYLTGERTPHVDPHARGGFLGLNPSHGRAHMARAVLEGATYGLKDCLDLIQETGVTPDSIRLSGGGAGGTLWRRVCTDVFGLPTVTTTTTEGTGFGAALLAGVGCGFWSTVEEACAGTVHERDRMEPGADEAFYHGGHARYRALYPALRNWWAQG